MADPNLLPLDQLLTRLATVVGAERVYALPAQARYGSLLGPAVARRARPRAVVTPSSAEQIQQLVRLVPRLAHEVWVTPNASGFGARAGDGRRPAVLIDLGHMRRIVDIDRQDGCALLEAGVTFAALASHLRERELPFMFDVEANGAAAVVGSLLERRWGVGPWGDRSAALCGIEAVLPNGTLLRTGLGALPGNDTWIRARRGYGPALDGLMSGAGLGIVTRFGLWLAPRPPRLLPFSLSVADAQAVPALIDALHPLLLDGTLGGTVGIASPRAEAALPGVSAAPVDAPRAWRIYGALAGHEHRVDAAAAALRRTLPAVLLGDAAATDPAWTARARLLRGEPLYDDAAGMQTASLHFAALTSPRAGDVRAVLASVEQYLRGFAPRYELRQAARAVVLEVEVDAAGKAYGARRDALQAAMNALVEAGYGILRAAPQLDAAVGARQGSDGLHALHHALRAALDPYAPRRAARTSSKPGGKGRSRS